MDAVKGFIFPGSTEPGQDDGVPWWMKYASKAAGLLGGVGQFNIGAPRVRFLAYIYFRVKIWLSVSYVNSFIIIYPKHLPIFFYAKFIL